MLYSELPFKIDGMTHEEVCMNLIKNLVYRINNRILK